MSHEAVRHSGMPYLRPHSSSRICQMEGRATLFYFKWKADVKWKAEICQMKGIATLFLYEWKAEPRYFLTISLQTLLLKKKIGWLCVCPRAPVCVHRFVCYEWHVRPRGILFFLFFFFSSYQGSKRVYKFVRAATRTLERPVKRKNHPHETYNGQAGHRWK